MNRSGYSDDLDDWWTHIRWRGAVTSAIKGRRGQAFLQELAEVMDAMEDKKLIAYELTAEGSYCTLGAICAARGIDLSSIDAEDVGAAAAALDIAYALAAEIIYENDESWTKETPEQRWQRMRKWVADKIMVLPS